MNRLSSDDDDDERLARPLRMRNFPLCLRREWFSCGPLPPSMVMSMRPLVAPSGRIAGFEVWAHEPEATPKPEVPDTPSDTDRQDALTRDEIACAHLASLCTAAMKSGPEVLTVFLNRIETITNEVRQAAGAKRLDKHKREDT